MTEKLTGKEAFFIRHEHVGGLMGIHDDQPEPESGEIEELVALFLRSGWPPVDLELRARDCINVVRQAERNARADQIGVASSHRRLVKNSQKRIEGARQALAQIKSSALLQEEIKRAYAVNLERQGKGSALMIYAATAGEHVANDLDALERLITAFDLTSEAYSEGPSGPPSRTARHEALRFLASHWKGGRGLRPTVTTDPVTNERTGPFVEFVRAVAAVALGDVRTEPFFSPNDLSVFRDELKVADPVSTPLRVVSSE